jgi:hypothetical protein
MSVSVKQRSPRSPGAYPSPTFQHLTVLAGDSSGGAYLPVHGVNLPKSTGTPADLAAKGIVTGDLYNNGGVICVAP